MHIQQFCSLRRGPLSVCLSLSIYIYLSLCVSVSVCLSVFTMDSSIFILLQFCAQGSTIILFRLFTMDHWVQQISFLLNQLQHCIPPTPPYPTPSPSGPTPTPTPPHPHTFPRRQIQCSNPCRTGRLGLHYQIAPACSGDTGPPYPKQANL